MKRALILAILMCSAVGFGFAQSAKATPQKPKAQFAAPAISSAQTAKARAADPAAAEAAKVAFARLPLSFEENQGQTSPEVRFASHGAGYNLFLTPSEAVLALHKGGVSTCVGADRRIDKQCVASRQGAAADEAVVWLQMVGANANAQVVGVDQLSGKLNYYIGNDPKKWRAGIPLFARVAYNGIYPGIDLTYYGSEQQLESDYIVAPGADPRSIQFHVAGVRRPRRKPDSFDESRRRSLAASRHLPDDWWQAPQRRRPLCIAW
jgi:hypothetical protein